MQEFACSLLRVVSFESILSTTEYSKYCTLLIPYIEISIKNIQHFLYENKVSTVIYRTHVLRRRKG